MPMPAGWTSDDHLITCHPYSREHCRGVLAHCEVCDVAVCADPRSVRKATETGWHIVCNGCTGKLVVGRQVPFTGRFKPGLRAPWESA
jgi:hypothetical protein